MARSKADEDLVTPRGLHLPAAALEWRATRSGGPGGQHANTADTRVVLVAHLDQLAGRGSQRARTRLGPTVRVVAAESRSQWRNRRAARARLAERLDEAARPDVPRRPTRPSKAAQARRLEEKRQRGAQKSARRWRPSDD